MKRLIIFIVTTLFFSKAQAQIFHKKDSIRMKPIVQIGIGGYFGTNSYLAETKGLQFNNAPGYDRGLLVKACLNVTNKWSISTDFRYIQRSGLIDMSGENLSEHFYLSTSGMQYQVNLAYRVTGKNSAELFQLYTGLAQNSRKYKASSVSYSVGVPAIDTNSGSESFNGTEYNNYISFISGISRSLNLSSKVKLLVFNEFEMKGNELTVYNGFTNLNTGLNESYSATYSSFSMRLGICLIY